MSTWEDKISRRVVLGAGAALTVWGIAPVFAADAPSALPVVNADTMVVTLLGTGSPDLRTDRYGMSTLVQAGGLNLVFDAGRGCAVRLNQAGVALGKVDAVFITHFHSDHLNGLPDLWMTGYLPTSFGRRAKPLEIHGPQGIRRIITAMRDTFSDDVRIRLADEHPAAAGTELDAHEFSAEGVVYERNGVTVTAFEVSHGALIKPAYGYRVEFAGRSVLLSGDTRFDENLIAHGQGLDVLVHEVAVAPKPILDVAYIQTILNHHTTPEEAGIVFSRTRPRLAVFSHVVTLMDEKNPRPSDKEIEQRTRTEWTGDLIVGTDLTRLLLTPGGIVVQHFDEAHGFQPG
jgi:ribonuclease Z